MTSTSVESVSVAIVFVIISLSSGFQPTGSEYDDLG
jgi:hypothetical protein